VLHAFAVREGGATVDGAALLAQLQDVLPDYMVPSRIDFLDALPLTINGKVDPQGASSSAAPVEPGCGPRSARTRARRGSLEHGLLAALGELHRPVRPRRRRQLLRRPAASSLAGDALLRAGRQSATA
jgi:hypothetical protein